MKDFDKVVEWMMQGGESQKDAQALTKLLVNDKTGFEVALEMIDSGREYDDTAMYVLLQVVNTD